MDSEPFQKKMECRLVNIINKSHIDQYDPAYQEPKGPHPCSLLDKYGPHPYYPIAPLKNLQNFSWGFYDKEYYHEDINYKSIYPTAFEHNCPRSGDEKQTYIYECN